MLAGYLKIMIILTVAEMREADKNTISKGTPSKELMRRAAQGVFDSFDGWEGKRTLIICGSGNNGGDGYALAAMLKSHGCDAELFRVSDKFSEDGLFYYDQSLEKGVPYYINGRDSLCFEDYDIIVDCILGTGFKGVPREPIAVVIQKINTARSRGAYVISVDINSGMNGDTGEADIAVISDLTVSIGYYKTGLFKGRAKELIKKLVNVDIGIELP